MEFVKEEISEKLISTLFGREMRASIDSNTLYELYQHSRTLLVFTALRFYETVSAFSQIYSFFFDRKHPFFLIMQSIITQHFQVKTPLAG